MDCTINLLIKSFTNRFLSKFHPNNVEEHQGHLAQVHGPWARTSIASRRIWSRLSTHASSSDWQRSILDLGLELIYASLFLSFFFAFFCSYQFGPWFAKVVVATPAHFSGKKVTLKCKTPIRNRRPCCCWKNKRRLGN